MSNDLLSPKVSSKISDLIVAFEQRRNWILCDAWFVGCSLGGNNGHLRCFYQLLYTTSSRLYHRLANWRNKKFAYSKSLFIATKPHVFLKFLAFQSWLSHYIQGNPFLAGKIKRLQTTDMLCALVTELVCTGSTREHWNENRVFTNFVRILGGFYSTYMDIFMQ